VSLALQNKASACVRMCGRMQDYEARVTTAATQHQSGVATTGRAAARTKGRQQRTTVTATSDFALPQLRHQDSCLSTLSVYSNSK